MVIMAYRARLSECVSRVKLLYVSHSYRCDNVDECKLCLGTGHNGKGKERKGRGSGSLFVFLFLAIINLLGLPV